MMGVGKSTIGKRLSKKLKIKFIDIDKLIEKKEGSTINAIFENKGESYFRKIEKKVTLSEIKKTHSVIALGGGAFINTSIRKEVKNSCISFWLDLRKDHLLKRLKNLSKRPLLSSRNLNETINKIYSERKKFYNESNFKIDCNLLEKEEIVNKILDLYENT